MKSFFRTILVFLLQFSWILITTPFLMAWMILRGLGGMSFDITAKGRTRSNIRANEGEYDFVPFDARANAEAVDRFFD